MSVDFSNPLLYIALLLLLVGIIVLVFVGFIAWNRYLVKIKAHPVLLQFAQSAIVMAYKSSDLIFDQIGERLHSVQKVEIAKHIYFMLPDCISISLWGFKTQLCWKKQVSEEDFVVLVSVEYDKLVDGFSTFKKTILQDMLESMGEAQENPPLLV